MTGEPPSAQPARAQPMPDRVARPEIAMVVLQPTAFCNINCSYCYLPDRSNKHVMAQSTVTRLFSEVFASGWCAYEIIVLWHVGERKALLPDQRHPGERRVVPAVPGMERRHRR